MQFYLLAVLALFLHKADLIFVVLPRLFVLTSIAHGQHITNNNVNRRFAVYMVDVLILLLMWSFFCDSVLR